jgi:hypothetical protein
MIATRPLIRAAAMGEEARFHTQFGENLETADESVSNWHAEIGVGTAPAAALQQRTAWAVWSDQKTLWTSPFRMNGGQAVTIALPFVAGSAGLMPIDGMHPA